MLIAGLGRDEFDAERRAVAAAAAAGRAKELGAVSLSWAAPEGDGVYGRHRRGRSSSTRSTASSRATPTTTAASRPARLTGGDESEVERARVAAGAANAARDLQNLPSNFAHPFLAERAADRAKRASRSVELLDRDAIEAAAWARSPRWRRAASPSRA